MIARDADHLFYIYLQQFRIEATRRQQYTYCQQFKSKIASKLFCVVGTLLTSCYPKLLHCEGINLPTNADSVAAVLIIATHDIASNLPATDTLL